MPKLLFLDVETTGCNHKENGLIQIAGIIEVDNSYKEDFNFLVRPFRQDLISPEAEKKHGFSEDQILAFPHPMDIFPQVLAILDKYIDRYNKYDKFILVGYNVRFDEDFLRIWFLKCREEWFSSYFWWPSIDISNLIALKYLNYRHTFKNYQLETVAEALGFNLTGVDMHNAENDIALVYEIYDKELRSIVSNRL